MVMTVVTVGNRKFVSGLFWEVSPGEPALKYAKQAGKQGGERSVAYVLLPGNNKEQKPSQFGLGYGEAGHRQALGLPSLAAYLALRQTGSWIGAFAVQKGFVIIVAQDGMLTPQGDAFFATAEEARQALMQELSHGRFDRVYAPKNWNIPQAESVPLTTLVEMSTRAAGTDVRLKQTRLLNGLVRTGSIVLIVGLVLAALFHFVGMKL